MPDTMTADFQTRSRKLPRTLRSIALLGIVLAATTTTALARELEATVVWKQSGRAYLATPDSGEVERGMRVRFLERGRERAAGEIELVADGRLAAVRITSGSLEGVKRLDRLRVFGESPPVVVPSLLRVGYPGTGRVNLLFECREWTPALPKGFNLDPGNRDSFRLIRTGAAPAGSRWPDTLAIRRYEDSADEEIALERGELDVAVFWPGELSARMRRDPSFAVELGLRSFGVLSAMDSTVVDTAFAALNRELFGGDLLAWPVGPPLGDRGAETRYTIPASMPGQREMDRVANRGRRNGPRGPIMVGWQDGLPAVPSDSSLAVLRARGITPLFSARFPVVSRPELGACVRAFGAGTFADLTICRPDTEPGSRRPR